MWIKVSFPPSSKITIINQPHFIHCVQNGGLEYIAREYPDIFCVQETKCIEKELPMVGQPLYTHTHPPPTHTHTHTHPPPHTHTHTHPPPTHTHTHSPPPTHTHSPPPHTHTLNLPPPTHTHTQPPPTHTHTHPPHTLSHNPPHTHTEPARYSWLPRLLALRREERLQRCGVRHIHQLLCG